MGNRASGAVAASKRGAPILSREREGNNTQMDCYSLLGNAVVKRAADDYIKALCSKYKHGSAKEIERLKMLADCELFFTGDLIDIYTKLDGRELMKGIQQMCEIHNYDIDKIDVVISRSV